MSSNNGFSVRVCGCTLSLSASCREGQLALERWVFPSLPREDGLTHASDVSLHIEKIANEFAIWVDGVRAALAPEERALPLCIVRAVDDVFLSRVPTLKVVHAGSVSWRGRALLLPGQSHSGKSSLVIELLRHGASYLSDEYALIDNDGLVHAYPRPILLRNEQLQQTPVLPHMCGAIAPESALPVGWIAALQYSRDADWNVTCLAQSEGLMTLLQNTPHVLSDVPEITTVFGRAVAGARCYAGSRNHATEAAGKILELIDQVN